MQAVLFILTALCLFFQSCNKCGDPFWIDCKEEDTVYGQIGCYSAGYSQAESWGQIGVTFNNQYYDTKMNEEVYIQRNFFVNVPAAVYVLYENSPQYKNAYATPDGYILFGYYMFYYTVSTYGELAAAGVLAHEWGHRTQFVANWHSDNPFMELEADAFSGYYMGLQKQWAWSQIKGYYDNVYALGDYYYNHPQHHGTPDQRLAAAYLGVNTAIQAINNNQPYSYTQLHQIFQEGISAISRGDNSRTRLLLSDSLIEQIIRIAKGQSEGVEVSYSRKLNKQDVDKLKPYM